MKRYRSAGRYAHMLASTLSMRGMQMRAGNRGFTLTETLVALVAGLVVVGSVMVYAISAMRSNAQIVAGARLMQQMRHALDTVSGEIRRAGYYEDSARFAPGSAKAGLSDAPVVRSPSCVIVRYDHNGAEFHGYRHVQRNGIGVVQTVTTRGVEPECAAQAGGGLWSDLTDPGTLDVRELEFAPSEGAGGCTSMRGFAVIAQNVDVHLRARLIASPATERTLAEAIRVRNDIMASGSCT